MKKMITLFAALILVSISFAQYDRDGQKNYEGNGRNMAYNDHKNRDHFDRYYFSDRERNMEIAHINKDYDRKINSVMNRFFWSRQRKESVIRSLEAQRRNEIRMVNEKYYHRDNRYNDHDWRKH